MKSAVLFIIFKREDTTKRVFERIREAQPPRLYIAADGPRKDRKGETEKCQAARKVVETIDWPCEVHRLYRDENMGCGKGVSSAISWFFENEEQGIIIEDDILPHIDFFSYCDEMLDRYNKDERIQLIAGSNFFYDGYDCEYSYYMSSFSSIWGWASWARVWKTYQYDLNSYNSEILIEKLKKRFSENSFSYFCEIYKKMLVFKVDTWDYQVIMNQVYFDRYSILPFINMVQNIGIGEKDATHTKGVNSLISDHKSNSPFPFRHPSIFYIDERADYVTMINTGQYIKPLYYRCYTKLVGKFRSLINILYNK